MLVDAGHVSCGWDCDCECGCCDSSRLVFVIREEVARGGEQIDGADWRACWQLVWRFACCNMLQPQLSSLPVSISHNLRRTIINARRDEANELRCTCCS